MSNVELEHNVVKKCLRMDQAVAQAFNPSTPGVEAGESL